MTEIPETMNSMVLTGHGGLDKLEYRRIPVPQVQHGEVLIKVAACGVNNTDINTRTGWYAPSVKSALTEDIGRGGVSGESEDLANWDRSELGFPRVQGADACGRIVAVGDGVDAGRIGERVVTDPCIRDPALWPLSRGVQYFGSERDGGYAEYTTIPSGNAVAVDCDLTDVELASFPCSYTTAEEMLVRIDLGNADTVLITGASGGVGSAAVQLAKRRGATVIAHAGRSKEEAVRALGADHFIAREDGPLLDALHALVGERTLDAVADVIGGDDFGGMLRALRRAGRYVSAGAIAGPCPEIDLRDLIYKDLQLWGVGNPQASTMRSLAGYIERGEIKPLIAKTFPLAELRAAHEEFLSKRHVGKIVMRIE